MSSKELLEQNFIIYENQSDDYIKAALNIGMGLIAVSTEPLIANGIRVFYRAPKGIYCLLDLLNLKTLRNPFNYGFSLNRVDLPITSLKTLYYRLNDGQYDYMKIIYFKEYKND